MSVALASISNRLTSAQAQLLERSRVLTLGLVPSPSATTSLVRTLTGVRNDLAKAEDEAALENNGLSVGGKAPRTGKRRASDALQLDELTARYDRLVEMLQADEDGRGRAKALVREKR
jgi:syntaxin 8